MAAEQQGDLFGLVGFNDKVNQFVRAKSGKAHFDSCRDAIYTQHPKMVSPDFDELCAFLRTRLRKRALLVFLTALDDPLLAESFSHNMDLLCRQHLILVNMPKPPGADPLWPRARDHRRPAFTSVSAATCAGTASTNSTKASAAVVCVFTCSTTRTSARRL